MQKRARRPHGIRARKISISVSEADLEILTARARHAHRGNLSAVVHELALALARQQSADELLQTFGGESVTEAEMDAVRAEIRGPKRKRRTAA